MLTKLRQSKVAKAAAALAVLSAGAFSLVSGAPNAGADPKWTNALIGHGSDTTQDVVGALAGEESGVFYAPVTSSAASGAKILNSWDATGTACVTPRAPGATIQRGNGSTNGRRILSRSIDSGLWGTNAACASKLTSGLVDFARSSAGPGSFTGTQLTYIPFARDALSFGYVANGVTPVTELDREELRTIFTTDGGAVIDGVRIYACGIQTGSGTYQSWRDMLGLTDAQDATGTEDCTLANGTGRLQENDGNGLLAKSSAFANAQVIVGFSASNYISQNNGAVTSQLPNPPGTVRLGSIDVDGPGGAAALGVPYTGTPGSPLTPSSAFYTNTTFGRDVYNVVPTSKLGGLPTANADLKSMFVGSTSAVCLATETITKFGFLVPANCGDTSLQGGLVPNS